VFNEELLTPQPNIDADKARRCAAIQAIATPIDRQFLTRFLVDFSWGSSVLEGSTYSVALHPIEAALYLMTRIPYVQVFANGNKRTSRLAANTALLAGGLLPFSFADVDKALRASSAALSIRVASRRTHGRGSSFGTSEGAKNCGLWPGGGTTRVTCMT
jgi:hypothetical protein